MTERAPATVQAFLNERPFSAFQWRIFALCFAVVMLDGFDTGAVGFVAPSLIQEWGVARPALAPVLSAALFGLAAGALFAGPLADRVGRKLVLVVSVAVFGAASLLAGFAGDIDQLTLLRFVTGVGLGAAMPNAVTLMSEYCPDARRAALTNAMFCGFPLGASLGGVLAAWLIPHAGWRSVFMLGGIAPLVLAVLLILLLPESVRYLMASGRSRENACAILAKVGALPSGERALALGEAAPAAARAGVRLILSTRYLVGSVMLWVAYFMGLVIFYALINWMPVLLRDSGIQPQTATLVSALFPLGGVGAVLSGWLMDRFDADRIVAVTYASTAVALYAVGQAVGNLGLLIVVVLVAGTLMNTAQSSLPSLAAAFYPTEGRATGVAWMMGIGRFGGIVGSFLVGELSRRQLQFGTIFGVVALPGLIACGALLIKRTTQARLTSRTPA